MRLPVALVILASTSAAIAGPDWTEIPDARKIPPAQVIPFSPVNSIMGELIGLDAAGGADTADLYVVTLGPGGGTVKTGSGSPLREANFDTILAVFNMDGTGVVANDDVGPGDTSSQVTISTSGTFLVAVAAKGVQPASAGGIMFNIYSPGNQFAQVPPNNPAGNMPVANWSGTPIDPEPRNYLAHVTHGSPAVPAVSEVALVVLGAGFAVGAFMMLRRGLPVG
ncbi:MAG: hypothetical protein JNK58_12350 [Phycisphaerae bacterium]|nr:hypothetical protein [Phycisphaerae bacterium]